MMAQIINLAEYRKAKATQEVRRVLKRQLAEHSQVMAWVAVLSCRADCRHRRALG